VRCARAPGVVGGVVSRRRRTRARASSSASALRRRARDAPYAVHPSASGAASASPRVTMVFRTGTRARPTRSIVDAMSRVASRRASRRVASRRVAASRRGVASRRRRMRHCGTRAPMRARGFPPAAQPDIVRAAQKDETYAAVRGRRRRARARARTPSIAARCGNDLD